MLKLLLQRTIWSQSGYKKRPLASKVVTSYLLQRNYPRWTSFFVAYKDVQDDHFAKSSFNLKVNGINYMVLRTGAYPFIKYHCTQHFETKLQFDDWFYWTLKVVNLGIPCFLYGVAGQVLARHFDFVRVGDQQVKLRFWYAEV